MRRNQGLELVAGTGTRRAAPAAPASVLRQMPETIRDTSQLESHPAENGEGFSDSGSLFGNPFATNRYQLHSSVPHIRLTGLFSPRRAPTLPNSHLYSFADWAKRFGGVCGWSAMAHGQNADTPP